MDDDYDIGCVIRQVRVPVETTDCVDSLKARVRKCERDVVVEALLSSITHGVLLFALPSRYWRSAWFGITAHSGQSIFFAVLMLLLILGLA